MTSSTSSSRKLLIRSPAIATCRWTPGGRRKYASIRMQHTVSHTCSLLEFERQQTLSARPRQTESGFTWRAAAEPNLTC